MAFYLMSDKFASSKDRPLQRTFVTLTSERVITGPKGDGTTTHPTTKVVATRPRPTSNSTQTLSSKTHPDLPSPAPQTSIPQSPTPSPTRAQTTPREYSTTSSPNPSTANINTNTTSLELAPQPGSRGLLPGTIASIVIGVFLGLTLAVMLLWICLRHRRRGHSQDPSPHTLPDSLSTTEPPQLAELDPDTHRIATPEPRSWFSHHDPRLSTWQGVQSPTPKPAVAEVKSFTRAWQKPRVYDIGPRVVAELPADEPVSPAPPSGSGSISPISPAETTRAGSAAMSPVTPRTHSRYDSLQYAW
ncbi:hypothetical protein G7046_g6622 [Stylonectria norvegica]|nr:hypothetical protein G7046_g6622 [Stylonectria norvegica]